MCATICSTVQPSSASCPTWIAETVHQTQRKFVPSLHAWRRAKSTRTRVAFRALTTPKHLWGILDAKDQIVDDFLGVLQMLHHGRTIAQSLAEL